MFIDKNIAIEIAMHFFQFINHQPNARDCITELCGYSYVIIFFDRKCDENSECFDFHNAYLWIVPVRTD